MKNSEPRRQMTDPAQIRGFALAGDARLTLESAKTGQRFTFRITTPDDCKPVNGQIPSGRAPIWFVSLLTGQNNEADYRYFGNIRQKPAGEMFDYNERKGKVPAEAPSVKGFAWFWAKLMKGQVSPDVMVWHEGRCGRCNRLLTVPASIEAGIGPECIKHVGGFFAEAVDVKPRNTMGAADFDDAFHKGFKPANTAVGTKQECYNAAFDPAVVNATPRKLAGHATATGWSAKPERKAKPAPAVINFRDDSLDGLFGV